jgi:membrane fusion protein (multidrug efflux system)
MLLTVKVVTSQHEALVIPEGAIFQVQNRAYVYRLDGQTARQQQIEIGARRFGTVEVKSGLQEGDSIVVEGIVKLRDGIQVRFAEAAGAVSERSGEQHDPPGAGARGAGARG